MKGLQVESGHIWIAPKYNSSPRVEGKILFNDILDSYPVCTVIDGIGTKHIERSFIIKSSTDCAIAIQGNIVVGIGIHQQAQGRRWCTVNEEVDIDIRRNVDFLIIAVC